MTKLPLPILIKYKPDLITERKREYDPPFPFQIGESLSNTPMEVVLDYFNLFIFLMGMGYCAWILFIGI